MERIAPAPKDQPVSFSLAKMSNALDASEAGGIVPTAVSEGELTPIEATRVIELINTFEDINKVKIPYVFGPRRKGDFGSVIADNSLSKNLLNWVPKKNLEDMCKDGWQWFTNERIKR